MRPDDHDPDSGCGVQIAPRSMPELGHGEIATREASKSTRSILWTQRQRSLEAAFRGNPISAGPHSLHHAVIARTH
jgi:hypothetical protein